MAKSKRVVGRHREKKILDAVLDSAEPEFLAIYGRRRVGKTHLIREYCEPRVDLFFDVTGQKDAATKIQLFHFKQQLERVFFGGTPLPELRNWEAAFTLLCDTVERRLTDEVAGRVMVFLDELPWLTTPRSRLLQALEHSWNARMSRMPRLCLVVCGSAASWMLDKLIHARGGLHNRLTRQMRLEPLGLRETEEYLAARGVRLERKQLLELYMALGGVPYYLNQVERGRSATQNVAEICFGRDGALAGEYQQLFASLFRDSELYERIVRAIGARREGVQRDELLAALGMTSGGRLNARLRELEEAGFITALTPYRRRSKNTAYRLIDEYVGFHHKWIAHAPKRLLQGKVTSYWQLKRQTPGYRAWAGFAFEGICLKHAPQISQALGLEAIAAEVGTWRHVPPKGRPAERGVQVDLLFDRADDVITLCEVKFSDEPFTIDKRYARELQRKLEVFEQRTKTRKSVFLALVAPHGLKANTWSEDLVHNVVTAEDLFA